MSGFFTIGEKKDRPGIYKRRENISTPEGPEARAGIGCAVVSGDWGELNKANVITIGDDISQYVGSPTGSGYKTIEEMFRGGAESIVVVRAGTGGTAASVTLKDDAETPANVVTLTAKYAGTMPLSVSVKENLADSSVKDVTLYTGTTVLENFQITAGSAEVDGIVAALADSDYVTASKVAAGTGTLGTVTQSAFSGGVAPTVNAAAYGAALDVSNSEINDVVVVDTNDTDVHAVVAAYIERVFQGGSYTMAVLSEPGTVTLANRMLHVSAYDDEKIVYVLGGWKDASDTVYDGYLAAARIGGMITGVPASDSLTHTAITGAVTLTDALTNAQIIAAIQAGALVISRSRSGLIMIEKAINTLKTIDAEKDAGWKKIRRTKTRFEMMDRIDGVLEPFIGAVNNDDDGRAAIIAAGQSVLDAMAGEGKILPGGTFSLDEANPPVGDSAWFIIQVDDIDSFETGYLTFRFRFSTEE